MQGRGNNSTINIGTIIEYYQKLYQLVKRYNIERLTAVSSKEQSQSSTLNLNQIFQTVKSICSEMDKYKQFYQSIAAILIEFQIIPQGMGIEESLTKMSKSLQNTLRQNVEEIAQLKTTSTILKMISQNYSSEQIISTNHLSYLSQSQQQVMSAIINMKSISKPSIVSKDAAIPILKILDKIVKEGPYAILQTQYTSITNEKHRKTIHSFVDYLQTNTVQLNRSNRITDFISNIKNFNEIREVQQYFYNLKSHHQHFLQPIYNFILATLQAKVKNDKAKNGFFSFNNKKSPEKYQQNSEIQSLQTQILNAKTNVHSILQMIKGKAQQQPKIKSPMLKNPVTQVLNKLALFENQNNLKEDFLLIKIQIKKILQQLRQAKEELFSVKFNHNKLKRQNQSRERSSLIFEDQFDRQEVQQLQRQIQKLKQKNSEKEQTLYNIENQIKSKLSQRQQIFKLKEESINTKFLEQIMQLKAKNQLQLKQNNALRVNEKKIRQNFKQLQENFNQLQQQNKRLLQRSKQIILTKPQVVNRIQVKQQSCYVQKLDIKQDNRDKDKEIEKLREQLAEKELKINALINSHKQTYTKLNEKIKSLQTSQEQQNHMFNPKWQCKKQQTSFKDKELLKGRQIVNNTYKDD